MRYLYTAFLAWGGGIWVPSNWSSSLVEGAATLREFNKAQGGTLISL